jgi:uncharacterized protein YjbI with pentapeptide repeats
MANPEHLAIFQRGVDAWNDWRSRHPEITPDFDDVELAGGILVKANLRRANLSRANLRGADLKQADLRSAILVLAKLGKADLRGANVRSADLERADLIRADARGTNLSGAKIRGGTLRGINLLGANLYNCNLTECDLYGAHIRDADLRTANFGGSDLRRTTFAGAELSGCKFTGSKFDGTVLADVDLSEVTGLEAVEHRGPSMITIGTVYKSRGTIPEKFLRGCGVPDDFIAYIGSMVGRPIEFYSCFISYSTKDQEFAERLHADLQDKGVRCWFAPHDIKGGRKLHEQLDEAIRLHDKLLLILSEHSLNSPWVKTEIANARAREEREKKQMLFPITLAPFAEVQRWKLFDADRGVDSAREIREYFIPDFSNWKNHDSYQKAFQRLISDLKAEASE